MSLPGVDTVMNDLLPNPRLQVTSQMPDDAQVRLLKAHAADDIGQFGLWVAAADVAGQADEKFLKETSIIPVFKYTGILWILQSFTKSIGGSKKQLFFKGD